MMEARSLRNGIRVSILALEGLESLRNLGENVSILLIGWNLRRTVSDRSFS